MKQRRNMHGCSCGWAIIRMMCSNPLDMSEYVSVGNDINYSIEHSVFWLLYYGIYGIQLKVQLSRSVNTIFHFFFSSIFQLFHCLVDSKNK